MTRAAAGSAAFALVGPGVELVLAPWVLTGFDTGDGLPGAWPWRVLGAVLIAAGFALLAAAFARFVGEGRGTPSPLAPPQRPVLGGVYGRLRHPMYSAASLALVGEGLVLRRPVLLVGAGCYALTMAAVVRWVEEPLLRRRFGEHWRSSSGPV